MWQTFGHSDTDKTCYIFFPLFLSAARVPLYALLRRWTIWPFSRYQVISLSPPPSRSLTPTFFYNLFSPPSSYLLFLSPIINLLFLLIITFLNYFSPYSLSLCLSLYIYLLIFSTCLSLSHFLSLSLSFLFSLSYYGSTPYGGPTELFLIPMLQNLHNKSCGMYYPVWWCI